jgi:hypothetical protein
LDIHKSKLVVAKWHSINAKRTYTWLDFSTNSSNISCQNYFWKENLILDINVKPTTSTKYIQQIELFLIVKRPRSSRNSFYGTTSFLNESFMKQNLNIAPLNIFALFFDGHLSSVTFNTLFFFFSNLFAIKMCSTSTIFF